MIFKCPECGEERINAGWICSNCKTDKSKLEKTDILLHLTMEDYNPEYDDEQATSSSSIHNFNY